METKSVSGNISIFFVIFFHNTMLILFITGYWILLNKTFNALSNTILQFPAIYIITRECSSILFITQSIISVIFIFTLKWHFWKIIKTSIVEELERNISFTVQHSLHVYVPPLNGRNINVIFVKLMIHCCYIREFNFISRFIQIFKLIRTQVNSTSKVYWLIIQKLH